MNELAVRKSQLCVPLFPLLSPSSSQLFTYLMKCLCENSPHQRTILALYALFPWNIIHSLTGIISVNECFFIFTELLLVLDSEILFYCFRNSFKKIRIRWLVIFENKNSREMSQVDVIKHTKRKSYDKMINAVLCDRNIFRETKLTIYKCIIQNTVTCGAETWKCSIMW